MIANRVRELRTIRAGDLVPNAKNWRRHPEQQVTALRAMLAEVGYASALVARELPDGQLELVDGHLRRETTPDDEVPVLVVDLSDDEAAKVLATLDPIGAMAGIDTQQLKALLQGIETSNEDLRTLLDGLADQAAAIDATVATGECDPDDIPAPPDAATTQPGDLWILGDHRLLCGDSSKADDVDRLLDGATIHLVNTDPPYNVKVAPRSNNAFAAGLSDGLPMPSQGVNFGKWNPKEEHKGTHSRTGKTKTTEKLRAKDRPLANDFVSDEAFDELLNNWFGNMARVLAPGRGFYIWGGYANCGNYPPVLKAMGLYFSQAIIWVKEHPVLTRKDFMGNHEWCFYGWREGAAHVYLGPSNAVDVWSVKKVNPQSMEHLTQKPVELAVRAMQYSSRTGENVLDLFAGSGSTLIAAEQTGRRCFTMELDPLYCDVVIDRWQRFTGKQAILAATGEPFPNPPPTTTEQLR